MKFLTTLILSAFVASVQSSKYADVKYDYDMVATSKSSKSRSVSSSSSSKSGKSSYFHDELATQYIRVRAGKVRQCLACQYRIRDLPLHCIMYPLSVFIYIIVCILILLVYYSDVTHTHRLMEEEEEEMTRNLANLTRNLVNLVKIVAQRAVMLARKAVVAAGVAGLTHPSQVALLLQGMFIRFW